MTPTAGYYGVQLLEVTGHRPRPPDGTPARAWNPVYRAVVPVFVAPPAPVLDSITASGQTVSGSTSDNNSSSSSDCPSTSPARSARTTVSVYMDGGTTPWPQARWAPELRQSRSPPTA